VAVPYFCVAGCILYI